MTKPNLNIPDRNMEAGIALSSPAIIWMSLLFITPLLVVMFMSFLSRSRGGGELPYTLESYQTVFGGFYEWEAIQEGFAELGTVGSFAEGWEVFGDIIAPDNPYGLVLIRSIRIALITTLITLFVGYPLAYYISTRESAFMRTFTLFLVILPFWTNFLIRTYAWRVILGEEGVINNMFLAIGLIDAPLEMLYTQGAVIVGLVYGFLPFMVLPIYAAVERFDFSLVEAAHDLGANDWSAFWRVVLPGTLPGVVAGCILVFIPSIGSYVTPDLLGGTDGLMIGNLIAGQFKGTGHWPRGSTLSIVLMFIVMLSLWAYNTFGQSEPTNRKEN
ncbi:MAG: ABC transporter permease [Phototrophicaceae bacterium]